MAQKDNEDKIAGKPGYQDGLPAEIDRTKEKALVRKLDYMIVPVGCSALNQWTRFLLKPRPFAGGYAALSAKLLGPVRSQPPNSNAGAKVKVESTSETPSCMASRMISASVTVSSK